MTTITATVSKENDVKVLKEILERFGIDYTIEESAEDYIFSDAQIADFERTQQDFLSGSGGGRKIPPNVKFLANENFPFPSTKLLRELGLFYILTNAEG